MNPITIVVQGATYTIPADVAVSLEQFRLSMTLPDGVTPLYADIPSMAFAFLVDKLFAPALRQFPTPTVQAALTAMLQSQEAYSLALAASIAGSINQGV